MKDKLINLEHNMLKLFSELEQLQHTIFNHEQFGQKHDLNKSTPPDWWIEEDKQLNLSHESMIKSLHNHIICYFDMMKLNSYLDVFIKKFGEFPNTTDAYNGIDFEPFNGQIYSQYLHELWSFLSPFDFFKKDLSVKQTGIKYLETILKNTATVIYKMGKKPTSEPQVYNEVKILLESIFPTSKNASSNFLKTAKEFKPDILIPELSAAIEYKYAKDETKLKTTIEQIAADVKGYNGDQDYNVYYAVFYVTNDFWGESKFEQVWADNKFPKNWRAFYVVGHDT
ncbi:PD-(D/E)XK nuclease domain-containing protein [Aliarcobacter vitoriensis]|uniref:Uncharacterized protein n=1 Tax=Aliarcobacter vitoriensis TaxID=2011099 RepID=A0A366MUN8_9BACT|nr:hypothetical protein [Aliarcobacter vitoriensis]RBQ29304.1 hypothetical protein CRU91_04265 [Aliarcobacter vitoriensis]